MAEYGRQRRHNRPYRKLIHRAHVTVSGRRSWHKVEEPRGQLPARLFMLRPDRSVSMNQQTIPSALSLRSSPVLGRRRPLRLCMRRLKVVECRYDAG